MADIKFTENQENAIYAPTGNLLVSAAAGSGKTAVLTQRVVEKLTGENPIGADELVVVTFTSASASEMKQRIQKKMRQLIAKEPNNTLFQSQLTMLAKAKISTIHALCNELIKENFEVLGIPLNYRMAEENEIKIIKSQILEEVIDSFYDSGDEDFITLSDFFTIKDDKALFETVSAIYEFVRPFPFYTQILDDFLTPYDSGKNINDSIWAKAVKPYIISELLTIISMLNSIYSDIYDHELVVQKYGEPYQNDLHTTKLLLASMQNNDWDRCHDILSLYAKMRFNSPTKFEDKQLLEHIKTVRTTAVKKLETLRDKFFTVNNKKYHEDIDVLTPIISKLNEVVKAYDESFQSHKLQNNILDFSDLEHYTLKLLVKRDGKKYIKTPTAKKLSEEFAEIMIDECQDINTVQNLIFWGLSKSSDTVENYFDTILKDSKNLFMVGDVKQSIYRFRNAMPTLFIKKSMLSPNFDKSNYKEGDMAKIILQNNFRSSAHVTDFVNFVFSQTMSENFGEVEYTQDEFLIPNLNLEDNPSDKTEVHILSLPKDKTELSEEDLDSTDYEARHIANVIENMLKTGHKILDKGNLRKCKAGDFCILLRSKKKKSSVYMNALKEKGLDCFADASDGYFNSFEISVMLDLLRIIDNPLQDIPLFSVLLSPMYMFTADDIAKIRITDKTVPLYIALTMAANLENDVKCKEFLASIDFLRQQSLIISTHKLIEMIYDSTDFMNIAESMISGDERRANLRLLLTYAQSYENIGYKGVSGFIRYVDNAIMRNEDFSCANVLPQNLNAVKIMSIHASKGLEFPICIIANAGKKANLMDLNKPYLFNPNYGIGLKISKHAEYKSYSNLPLEAIKYIAKKETLSEEMRTLYVAMTRPQCKLIIVGSFTEAEDKINDILLNVKNTVSDISMTLIGYSSYLEWILSAFAPKHKTDENFDIYENIKIFPVASTEEISVSEEEVATSDPLILAEISEKLSFEYEHKTLSQIPAKITVTQIAKASDELFSTNLAELSLDDNEKITGAMRGTVLHSFMQYADYLLAQTNLDMEISRLVSSNYLTESEAKLLNKAKINAFFKSDIYERIKKAKKIYREYQFIYQMNASHIYPDIDKRYTDEKIVVQGIADTVFIEDGGAVIVDYKTDIVDDEITLAKRYETQLLLYKDALSEHFDNGVSECYIYSLHLKKTIKIEF